MSCIEGKWSDSILSVRLKFVAQEKITMIYTYKRSERKNNHVNTYLDKKQIGSETRCPVLWACLEVNSY